MALIAAGLLWGTTVPLSKLALQWLQPGWLDRRPLRPGRAILLAVAARTPASRAQLRAACSPIDAGVRRDRVRRVGRPAERRDHPDQRHPRGPADRHHAGPGRGHRGASGSTTWPARWRGPGSPCRWPASAWSRAAGAAVPRLAGDGLVMASLLVGSHLYGGPGPPAARPRPGRGDGRAVRRRRPSPPCRSRPRPRDCPPRRPASASSLITVALAAGTLLPFTLFAFGQSRVSAEVAGAFLNIEPLVGAVAGDRRLRRPVRHGPGGRRRGHHRRHRPEHPADAPSGPAAPFRARRGAGHAPADPGRPPVPVGGARPGASRSRGSASGSGPRRAPFRSGARVGHAPAGAARSRPPARRPRVRCPRARRTPAGRTRVGPAAGPTLPWAGSLPGRS